MKKFSLPILLGFLLTTTLASAQDLRVGPKLGLNIANLGADFDGDPRVGFNIGATGLYNLSDNFSVGLDLIYSLQGARYDQPVGFNETETQTLNLNYLYLPIYAQFYPVNDLGLNFKAGVQPGIFLGASADGENQNESFKAVDICIPVGGGYEFDNGFAFDIRYAIGVYNIANDSDDSAFDSDTKISNQVVQLNLAYRFNL
ncbi:MAG: hypothetical protein CL843_07110 [Crocinitomicaceae bacterium]|nr:hypothetical protein [Crocinitomicaceae bacterium]|tara:strand:+ start:178 stop:780 length:603 start_codon:yes stop_codon:yes gene_type:complete